MTVHNQAGDGAQVGLQADAVVVRGGITMSTSGRQPVLPSRPGPGSPRGSRDRAPGSSPEQAGNCAGGGQVVPVQAGTVLARGHEPAGGSAPPSVGLVDEVKAVLARAELRQAGAVRPGSPDGDGFTVTRMMPGVAPERAAVRWSSAAGAGSAEIGRSRCWLALTRAGYVIEPVDDPDGVYLAVLSASRSGGRIRTA